MGLKPRPRRDRWNTRKFMEGIAKNFIPDQRTKGWVIMRVRDQRTPHEIVRRTAWLYIPTRKIASIWTSARSEAFVFPTIGLADTAVDQLRNLHHNKDAGTFLVLGA